VIAKAVGNLVEAEIPLVNPSCDSKRQLTEKWYKKAQFHLTRKYFNIPSFDRHERKVSGTGLLSVTWTCWSLDKMSERPYKVMQAAHQLTLDAWCKKVPSVSN
jgi:hypothetical protein